MGHLNNSRPMRKIVAPPECLMGVVKKVVSGDSVVLHGFKGNPPAERELIFLNVRAAKLGKRGTDNKNVPFVDEPWAWEAREYVRKKIIGTKVFFTSVKINQYEYGYVWFGNHRETAENLIESLVREGLVSVKKDSRPSPELKHLMNLERDARAAFRGRWSNIRPICRDLKWFHDNPTQIVKKYKQKPIKAIVEYVRDGSTLRVLLLPEYRYVTLSIAGIRCPSLLFDDKKVPMPKQKPFAHEARFFVEQRLLNRDVEVILESVINNTFVGSILYPRGDIAEVLLRQGLAKTVEWGLHLMGERADLLREAEKCARDQHLRLWEFDPLPDVSLITIKGQVLEVLLGDCIRIKLPDEKTQRVYFSSMKAPKSDTEVKRPAGYKPVGNALYDVPFMFQAREFLRKKLVGKTVICKLDYVLPIAGKNADRHYYSVFYNEENIAVSLVEQGLATCLNYKSTDDIRSPFYESMVKAQEEAKSERRGMFSPTDTGVMHVLHLTLENKRIRTQFLTSWQRASRMDAIVESLITPTRLRVFIPKHQCVVLFVLSGITCPRASRPANGRFEAIKEQPFGDQALEFCKKLILQRDVLIKIDGMDKFNTAVIGWLWLEDGTNLSVKMVENGLAELHVTAEKSIYCRQFRQALQTAQDNRLNIWSIKDIVERTEKSPKKCRSIEDLTNYDRNIDVKDVLITEITSKLTFFAQSVADAEEIESFSQKLQSYMNEMPPMEGIYQPKVGEICVGRFSIDKKWYRAKVLELFKETARVHYIDYGNTEEIKLGLLHKLPDCFVEVPNLATEYSLALLELPYDEEDRKEALSIFSQDILNHHLVLNIEVEPAEGPAIVTLYTPMQGLDVAKMMIADGLVMVSRTADRCLAPLLQEYQDIERAAFYNHIGIWKYGAFDMDNDDDEPL